MGKVKVSREVADFFEKCKNNGDMNWEDAVLHEHIKIIESRAKKEAVRINPDALCMLQYSPFELASILVLGYEVVLSPEEQVKDAYKSAFHWQSNQFNKGFAEGIKYTIETLSINIELEEAN